MLDMIMDCVQKQDNNDQKKDCKHKQAKNSPLELLPFGGMRLNCKRLNFDELELLEEAKLAEVVDLELHGFQFRKFYALHELMESAKSLKTLKLTATSLEFRDQYNMCHIEPHVNLNRLEIIDSSGTARYWLKFLLLRLLEKLPNLKELKLGQLGTAGSESVLDAIALLHEKGRLPNLKKLEMLELNPFGSAGELEKFRYAMVLLQDSLEELSVTVYSRQIVFQLMMTEPTFKKLQIKLVAEPEMVPLRMEFRRRRRYKRTEYNPQVPSLFEYSVSDETKRFRLKRGVS